MHVGFRALDATAPGCLVARSSPHAKCALDAARREARDSVMNKRSCAGEISTKRVAQETSGTFSTWPAIAAARALLRGARCGVWRLVDDAFCRWSLSA
jgi:hypothetical protein